MDRMIRPSVHSFRWVLFLGIWTIAAQAWMTTPSPRVVRIPTTRRPLWRPFLVKLWSSNPNNPISSQEMTPPSSQDQYDYEIPEDAVVIIQPSAMRRLRELRDQQNAEYLTLRMGVRSGGCSGMSYVMDFCDENSITEDDQIDSYETDRIQCVVDAKSMLYLFGLELTYSDDLIGGGFQFHNPNAEESCGCGSSFSV